MPRYLEVGCGFGFSLDFARFAFGWEVQGIDPSPLAAAGRHALDLEIRPDYLTPETDLGPRFDLVLCSEVLEHVADPRGFLALVRTQIAEDGALALTTPNAAAVQRDAPVASLLPILSPGHHLVLLGRSALEALLRDAGFPHVRVWEKPTTLHAVASYQSGPLRDPAVVDRAEYRRYLRSRAAAIPPDTPLGLGFAYRFFKESVCAADYGTAEWSFDRLRAGYRERFRVDPAEPASLDLGPSTPRDFQGFARAFPFNLTGVFFFRGIVAMNREGDFERARSFFHAAESSGRVVRAALLSIGADDGETEHLTWQARLHALYCAAALSPGAAADQLRELSREGARGRSIGADHSPIPRPLLAAACLQLVARLWEAGHYSHAARAARVGLATAGAPQLVRALAARTLATGGRA